MDNNSSPAAGGLGMGAVSTSHNSASAISGGYDGDSLTLRVLTILFPALTIYNAIELLILIFVTFLKYEGWYFWSLLVSSIGLVPYALGFLFKYNNTLAGTAKWTNIVLLTLGWWTMVTGQSVVLWSRLHLIVEPGRGRRIFKYTKWMIIIDAVILHIPTTVLTFGSNGDANLAQWTEAYNIMEKIQMSGFFIQELILSSIYIGETIRILNTSIRGRSKAMLWQLLMINVAIIIMDLGLLGLEAASQYLLETLLKGVFYSIKLKLEFAILGKLVKFVGGRGSVAAGGGGASRKSSVTFYHSEPFENELYKPTRTVMGGPGIALSSSSQSLEVQRIATRDTQSTQDSTGRSYPSSGAGLHPPEDHHAYRARSSSTQLRQRPGMTATDVDLAVFQHLEHAELPHSLDVSVPASPDDRLPAMAPIASR